MEETLEPSVEQQESTGLLDGATPEVEEADASENPQKVEIDHRDPEELKAKEEFGGEKVQSEYRLVDCTEEQLRSFYQHCKSMLYNTDKEWPLS